MKEKTAIEIFKDIKALLHNNEIDEALKIAESAIQLFPDEAEGYFLCAEIYRQREINNLKILEYLNKAHSLEPNKIQYIGRLAEQLFVNGHADLAIGHYQNILAREPLIWAYIGLGNALEMKGEFNVASLYFERAIDLNPNKSDALRARLEKIQSKQSNTLSVIDEYKKLLSDQLDDTQLFDITKLIALLYSGICKTTEAAYFYEEAAKLYKKTLSNYGVHDAQVIHPGLTKDTLDGKYGCIRLVNEEGVRGWFLNVAEKNVPTELTLLVDNKKLATVIPENIEIHVSAVLGYPTRCEFNLRWTDIYLDGQFDSYDKKSKHLITCKISETDIFLFVIAEPITLGLLENWIQSDFVDHGEIEKYDSAAITSSHEDVDEEAQAKSLDDSPNEENVVTKLIELNDDQKYQYETIKDHFDTAYYLIKYPEVRNEHVDPIAHYLTAGADKGFNPNFDFESGYYLSSNPDVKNSKINPFFHYIVSGRYEGRPYKQFAASERKAISTLQTLESRAKHWINRDRNPLVGISILNLLLEKFLTDSKSIVLSISHDNAMSGVGGIQLAIQQELELFNGQGYLYVHLYPKQPLPILDFSETSHSFFYGMSLNGTWVGFVSSDCLVEVFSDYRVKYQGKFAGLMVIHSLLGSNVDSLLSLHKAFNFSHSYLWLHDYFMICPQYTLLRNDITYCHAPKINKAGCEICVYHSDRIKHQKHFERLFGNIAFSLISPSDVAAKIFTDKTTLPYEKVIVSPHRHLIKRLLATQRRKNHPEIRVAYLGQLVGHKGWFDFEKLADTFNGSGKYKFYVFGVNNPDLKYISHINVHVTHADPDAMINALKEANIDIVVIGSKWPETFCFTAHEALVSGAAIVAHKDGGNVAALIEKHECGQIYENSDQLISIFANPTIDKLLGKSRQYAFSLEPGTMSACVIDSFL